MKSKLLAVALVVGLAFVASASMTVTTALALPDKSFWGQVTSGRATTEHDIGSHASSQDRPHVGLPHALGGQNHPSEVGQFLCTLSPTPPGCP